MNLGIIQLKNNQSLDESLALLTNANLPMIAVAGTGSHLLVRIDDTTRTPESIINEYDFIQSAELITGAAKNDLIKSLTGYGAACVSVLA